MGEAPRLSLAEWIVLALLAEQPRHGFAVASLTAPDGEVGRAWHVPRPIVYRAIARLTELELVEVRAIEHGDRGPQRAVLAATTQAVVASRRWLIKPVAHVRDARSELLVKLALLSRRGGRTQLSLLRAQREVFEDIESALVHQQEDEADFARVLTSWRTETVRAALRFLDDVEEQYVRHQTEPGLAGLLTPRSRRG